MTLREKLDLLNLSEEERKKAETKFLASLEFVSGEEIKDVLDFLNSKGITINKAREIKVITNPVDKLAKNIDFVENVNELGAYKEDPNRMSGNGLDIFKKVKYCTSNGIPYKNEDGTYKQLLFNESLFQQEVSPNPEVGNIPKLEDLAVPNNEEIVTFEPPVITPTENLNENLNEQLKADNEISFDNYMNATNDMQDIEAKTTDFTKIREDLAKQLAELDNYKNMGYEEISFGDIEPESYGMGRAA